MQSISHIADTTHYTPGHYWLHDKDTTHYTTRTVLTTHRFRAGHDSLHSTGMIFDLDFGVVEKLYGWVYEFIITCRDEIFFFVRKVGDKVFAISVLR